MIVLYGVVMMRFSVWRTKQQLNANSTELDDATLVELSEQMARALDIPRIKVHIYEIEPINGLAAPDGRIFITRGFMNAYGAGKVHADELASVIAHELGHVSLGHSRRRMVDFTGQNALRTVFAMVLNRFLPGIGTFVANFLMRLVSARLSRNDEFEADAYASALLVKAGIGTEPQKSMFRKLEKLSGARGATSAAWLMSHPKIPQRIAAIEANEKKWGAG